MKLKSMIYSGNLEISELPAVVLTPGRVLAKPMAVYIGDVERDVLNNEIAITKPLVLGSTGIVKIIETYGDMPGFIGKEFTVSPMGDDGLLGINTNGLLASYINLHPSHIEEETCTRNPSEALKPLIRHAVSLSAKCVEPVLVEGCDLIGIATGLAIRASGVEPIFYCERGARNALAHGFEVYGHLSNLSNKYRSVLITSRNVAVHYKLLRNLEISKLLISPLSLMNWIPLRGIGSVDIEIVTKERDINDNVVKNTLNTVSRMIKVFVVEDIEATRGLLPPRGLGFIVVFKKQEEFNARKTKTP